MKQSEISMFYKKYQWPKCSRTQYYKKVARWIDLREAIKPIAREERYKKWRIKTKMYEDELKRYQQQKWPKAERWRFYQRLYKWRTKEEAIRLDISFRPSSNKVILKKTTPYVRKTHESMKIESVNTWIDIKYSKEEADVFKKQYERMIRETEDARFETDDIDEARYLRNKLEELKAEYQLFISVNYKTNEQ